MVEDSPTVERDLRTGQPCWIDGPRTSVGARRQPRQDRYDVIVVGAGISGALAAELLSREGRSVLVVDRRPPVRGSTPASTAMIQHEIDVPLRTLNRQRGARFANAAWRRSVQAVSDLVDLASVLKLRCHMKRKAALFVAGDQLDGEDLAEEAAARNRIGITAQWLGRTQLRSEFGIDREAAILSYDSASAHPAQLTASLLRVAARRGVDIVSPMEITDFAEMPSGVALGTACGRVLTADFVVFCTGYEFLKRMQSKSHHVTSTWAIATAPLEDMPAWLTRTIVWEASDPYIYFRSDTSGRVIAGGEDEEAAEKNTSPAVLARKAKAIAAKVEKLSGLKLGKIDYRWGAPFSVTRDGLPIIDRVASMDRVFAVMGFGGNGITFSMIAAQIVAAAIAGKPDPDARLFALR